LNIKGVSIAKVVTHLTQIDRHLQLYI
jgi:hypothetical protein